MGDIVVDTFPVLFIDSMITGDLIILTLCGILVIVS